MRKFLALIGFITLASVIGVAQPVDSSYQSPTEIIDYDTQNEYTIGKINVEGARFTDKRAIMSISGLAENTKIRLPGPDIPKAIKNLWKIRLFTDVQVNLDKIIGDVAFITIEVTERPRLSRFSYEGAKKSQHDDLNEEVTRFAIRGGIVTDNVKKNCETGIKKYYIEKGFLDVAVDIQEIQDSVLANSVRLVFNIDKGPRIKIRDIVINGNESVSDKKIRKLMKKTKRKGAFFKSSKLVSKEFESDKRNIIGYYNTI
ncbi:MAG: outer membrane protein assembly factor BamA, partial [Bacteroidota bacterium]